MKGKLSLLLAVTLAMTMIMGMSITSFAETIKPQAPGALYLEDLPSGTVIDTSELSEGIIALIRKGGAPFETNINSDGKTLSFSEGLPYTFNIGPRDVWTIAENPFYVSPSPEPSNPAPHEHSFYWETIKEATKYEDGLEGEKCACGATRNIRIISALGFTLNEYATPMVVNAKPGQTIELNFGELNSFPKSFMEKVAEKTQQNVSFGFHYNWNHVGQEIKIPAGTEVDTNFDWYGPAKMQELYGAN